MNIADEASQMTWQKDWEGKLSLLLLHIGLPGYLGPLQKEFGFRLGHFLALQKEGITGGYWVEKELDEFGEKLSKIAEHNPDILRTWSNRLKQETDRINAILSEDAASLLDSNKFHALRNADAEFTLWQFVVRRVGDYLPQALNDSHGSELESARKYCEKTFYELEALINKLTALISEKSGIEAHLLECLTAEECETGLATGQFPSKQVLQERYASSGLYLHSDITALSGDDVRKIEASFVKERSDEIRGQVGYPGVVTGRVRVIRKFAEASAFEQGEILVTGMTDPNYVPLMKKAAAIVTDAGGILSHAAIVSRELKKPCVLGTKIAAQVLKDGDEVEVDAEKGVVKILKRA